MRRRLKKPDSENLSTRVDKDEYIIVCSTYGYQARTPGCAPAWGPIANATVFSKKKAEDQVKEIRKYSGAYCEIVPKP